MKSLSILLLLATVGNTFAHNHENHKQSHNSRHTKHLTSKMMIKYQYSSMLMENIGNDSGSLSTNEFFTETSFMMAPKKMTMKMHMLDFMYSLNGNTSFMLMAPYKELEMTMVKKMGRSEVTSKSAGMGDIKLGTHSLLMEHKLELLVLLSLPTGSITKEDHSKRLGYKMQLGSGSYGIDLGLKYLFELGNDWAVRPEVKLMTFLNDNSEDYRLGNRYFYGVELSKAFGKSYEFALNYFHKTIDPLKSNEDVMAMSPAIDPKSQHGNRDYLKTQFRYLGQGSLSKYELGLSYTIPLKQDLAGYQLREQNKFSMNLIRFF